MPVLGRGFPARALVAGRQVLAVPAGTTFNDSGSGTITLTGSGTNSQTHSGSGTGTITLSGSGTNSQVHTGSGAGTLTLTGTGTETASHSASGAGSITLAGSGVESYVPPSGGGTASGWIDQVLEILHVTHRL